MQKHRNVISFILLFSVISLFLGSVFTQNPSIIGSPEDGPLECALHLAPKSSNFVLDLMKIAYIYTDLKQYERSLFLTRIIGNEVFTEFYIIPAIVWSCGMDQKYSQARAMTDNIRTPWAKMIALTWLAKTYTAHHQDASDLLREAEQMVPALMEQWLLVPYTTENFFDFLKRVESLVNLSEAGVETGRKNAAKRIIDKTVSFIRTVSIEPGLMFLKGAALAEVALSRYQSGYGAMAEILLAEAEKLIMENTSASNNSPVFVELAAIYARVRKFDKALQIAGLLKNDTESYDRAVCLEKIAAEYGRAGQKEKAKALWNQILVEIPDNDIPGQIFWLANIGLDSFGEGDVKEARDFLQKALGIAIRHKDLEFNAYPEALTMIAGKYREIGERNIALELADEAYRIFQNLHRLDETPGQLFTASVGGPTQIQDIPAPMRTDLLGANLAVEYARLGAPLRSLQIIRQIVLIEYKVEGLIWIGKIFYDDGVMVDDEMRKILREITG